MQHPCEIGRKPLYPQKVSQVSQACKPRTRLHTSRGLSQMNFRQGWVIFLTQDESSALAAFSKTIEAGENHASLIKKVRITHNITLKTNSEASSDNLPALLIVHLRGSYYLVCVLWKSFLCLLTCLYMYKSYSFILHKVGLPCTWYFLHMDIFLGH